MSALLEPNVETIADAMVISDLPTLVLGAPAGRDAPLARQVFGTVELALIARWRCIVNRERSLTEPSAGDQRARAHEGSL
jgi:hypothetical protein